MAKFYVDTEAMETKKKTLKDVHRDCKDQITALENAVNSSAFGPAAYQGSIGVVKTEIEKLKTRLQEIESAKKGYADIIECYNSLPNNANTAEEQIKK